MARVVKDEQSPETIARWWFGAFVMLPMAILAAYMLAFVGMPPGFNLVLTPLLICVILATPIVFYRAGFATLAYLRFGRLTLRLVGDGPFVGGKFAAMLAVPKAAAAAKRVTAELVCIEIGRPTDGPDIPEVAAIARIRPGGIQGLLKWSSGRVEFPVRRGMLAGLAAIHFPIPAELPESGLREELASGRLFHLWELRVDAAVPGPDLARTFEIRVGKAA